MAERYFTDAPLSPGEFTLAGPDAHHLAAVKRAAPGDRVTLFNGDGHEYPAEVLAVGNGKGESILLIPERPVPDGGKVS